jgi:hypothetical protein
MSEQILRADQLTFQIIIAKSLHYQTPGITSIQSSCRTEEKQDMSQNKAGLWTIPRGQPLCSVSLLALI